MLGLVGTTVSVRSFTWLSCLNVYYCLWCDLFTLLAFKQIKKERNASISLARWRWWLLHYFKKSLTCLQLVFTSNWSNFRVARVCQRQLGFLVHFLQVASCWSKHKTCRSANVCDWLTDWLTDWLGPHTAKTVEPPSDRQMPRGSGSRLSDVDNRSPVAPCRRRQQHVVVRRESPTSPSGIDRRSSTAVMPV